MDPDIAILLTLLGGYFLGLGCVIIALSFLNSLLKWEIDMSDDRGEFVFWCLAAWPITLIPALFIFIVSYLAIGGIVLGAWMRSWFVAD